MTDYVVDEMGNVVKEATGGTSLFFEYSGSRLTSQATGDATTGTPVFSIFTTRQPGPHRGRRLRVIV